MAGMNRQPENNIVAPMLGHVNRKLKRRLQWKYAFVICV